MKKYGIIYADPPWEYESCTIRPELVIERHYPTMKLEDIKTLDIPAAKDAVLFLWVTAPKLREGLDTMQAWNFDYRTCAVWDKMRLGLGHWFRIDHELLLVGRKGNFPTPPPSARVSSVIRSPKRQHSRKPDIVRSLISSWYPDIPKIELFAREHFEGWDVFGDELPDTVQRLLTSSITGDDEA